MVLKKDLSFVVSIKIKDKTIQQKQWHPKINDSKLKWKTSFPLSVDYENDSWYQTSNYG